MTAARQRATSVLLALAGLGVLAALFWRFGTDLLTAALWRANPAMLALYAALAWLVVVSHAWRWRYVAGALGGGAPLGRFIAARIAGDAVGVVLPSARVGGDPVRIALLHGAGRGGRQAFAGVTIDRVLETISNTVCTMLFVGIFAVAGVGAASLRATSLWIGAVMLLPLAAFGLHLAAIHRGSEPLRRLFGEAEQQRPGVAGRLRALLVRIEEQVVEIVRRHLAHFVIGVVAALATQALVVLMYRVLLGAFGIDLPLPLLLMTFVASGFARAAPTPGGLGALEAAQVGLLALADHPAELGFVVGILMRLHDAIWTGLGVLVLLWQGVAVWRAAGERSDRSDGSARSARPVR